MMRRRSDGSGQALVEFALVLPIFMLLLFGLIDGGRYVYMSNVALTGRPRGRPGRGRRGQLDRRDDCAGSACVANAAAITAANPGAHVCPATVNGASNSLEADITAAANRMVAPLAP